MITVQEADQIIQKTIRVFPTVEQPFAECCGEVLREDIFADRDIPAFDKVLMDGIAINLSSYKDGNRRFAIEGTQAAGQPPFTLKDPKACVEIMTGAVLSHGCDCVIPIEKIKLEDNHAVVMDDLDLTEMKNVHPRGRDYKQGDPVLSSGAILTPPQIAVAASVGKATLKVSARPRIAIITTGDELVDVGDEVAPHQIRKANSYAIQSALVKEGYQRNQMFHLHDEKDEMHQTIEKILGEFDVLILSGGVSMGKFDFVPEVLQELGVKVLFHKVSQKPGKPFWFGQSREGKPVFALPGNPVSTQICFYRYVFPYLAKCLGGVMEVNKSAVLSEDFTVHSELTFFLPVKIASSIDGNSSVSPSSIANSGDFVGLAQSDGFVELEAGKKNFKKGTVVPFYQW